MVHPDVVRVVRLQVLLALAAAVLAAVASRFDIVLSASVLAGGSAVVIPALIYAKIAYAKRHVPPAELMRAHFKAEAVKFVLTVFIFMGFVLGFKDLSVSGLLIGYFAAASGYWFGLLIKN
jgi:ATP synthase protein I